MIEKVYPPQLPGWLAAGGDDFEVVIASEAFYVRNLADRPFPNRLDDEEIAHTRKQLRDSIASLLSGYSYHETGAMDELEREYLAERLSAPRELLESHRGTGLLLSPDESSWVCLNSFDNLRFRFATAGGDIEGAYREARRLEEQLEGELPFAYSERFGFLTSRPAECGTGLVLRSYVHIPGIIFTNGFSDLRDRLLKTGTTLRPALDESMSSEGHIFVMDTAHTLGVDEEELLSTSRGMISELAKMEFEARRSITSRARFQIEDKILRGIGVLTHAKLIAKSEGYALANALRLGSAEKLLEGGIDVIGATELYFVGQSAHITLAAGEGNDLMKDTYRAELFKSYLNRKE